MNVQQYYYDNFIDAKNEFISGGSSVGDINNISSNIIIAGGTGSNLSDYLYTQPFNNNIQFYINNSNPYGEIRFKNLYVAGNARDHEAKIDIFGKLSVYHVFTYLNPLYTEGWKDVEAELNSLNFNQTLATAEMIVVQGQLAGIDASISSIQGTLTTLEAYNRATVANLEALQYGFFNIDEYEEFVYNSFSALTGRYNQRIQDFQAVAIASRVTNFTEGLVVPAVVGAAIGGIFSYFDYTNLHNTYSNVLNSNPNLTPAQRRSIQEPTSNIIREKYLEFNSNFCNLSLEQGFINCNIITSQKIPSIKTNKILLGNITTPNSSYQMEMTGDLNANEYYVNSVSLSSLLNQKQNNMSATQPIFITTANIGLNYDASLTKVGNNLSVVKTASAPLKWTGNDVSIDYDNTLINNSGSLGVSIAAESKWGFTGANIYNKNLTNVGIGTLSGISSKLVVNGDIYLSSNINAGIRPLNFISSFTNSTLTQVAGGSEYYLQYTTSGTLVLNEPCACDLLIVGAGGNGGNGASSGGGGAGEVIYYTNFPLRNGSLNVNVGTASAIVANRLSSITHSSGTQISAKGGGNGGTFDNLFTSTGSITITIPTTILFNYVNSQILSAGTINITFSNGSITATGLSADKSYPLLKDGSGNTINPMAWYKFDDGYLLTDSGSGSYGLSNRGSVSINTSDFIKGDGCAIFNGSSCLEYSAGSNFNPETFSFSFWAKLNNTGQTTYQTLASIRGASGVYQNKGWTIYHRNDTGNLVFWTYDSSGFLETNLISSYFTSNNNVWRHFAFTILRTSGTNATLKFYFDNVLTINTTITYNSGSVNNFRIGAGANESSTPQYYLVNNSRIDDFRFYSGSELTSTQVGELYNGRALVYALPTSGGSGGGGRKSQSGAAAGVKFDDYKSFALSGLSGNSTTGGNGGSGNTTYSRFTTTITGTSLSVGLGGSGVGTSPATPATKTNYGDGGDGNSGLGFQGIIIIRFKADTNYLNLKSIKDNANSGLILNANESSTPYQLRIFPWSDTYTSTGIATRGWSFRVHDNNANMDLLNLFSSFGGRIGVKTKNPVAIFDVNGDINCKSFFVSGDEQYGILCQIANAHPLGESAIVLIGGSSGSYGSCSIIYNPANNQGIINCSRNLIIKTQRSDSYIYIDDASGYVGIGLTNPSSKLEVVGDIHSTSMTALTGNFNSVSTYGLALNNGNITGVNRVNSVDVWTGPIKATSLDLDGGNITNGGFFYGMAQQARFLNMSTGEWHYDTQSRERFYFTNDGSNSHTVFKTGSTTHYFKDKDNTDYCLLDRFGISTYFEVISGGGYDNIGVVDASVTGVYVYRRLLVRLSTFTEVHRCFCEDELYENYDDFVNEYLGRVVISTGKIKTCLKKEGEEWQIFEGKEGITIDDSHPMIELSRKKKDKRILGVITKREKNNDLPNRLVINSVGETAIWIINTNGNLENGDLVQTSDHLGYAERQDCDFIKNYTIGKIMIDCEFELDNPNYKCEEFEEGIRKAFVPIFIYSG